MDALRGRFFPHSPNVHFPPLTFLPLPLSIDFQWPMNKITSTPPSMAGSSMLPHIWQTTMAEDMNTVLGERFDNDLVDFDATYNFGHGES